MKALTAFDLHFLVKEFAVLEGTKINKIFVSEQNELLIQLHIPNKGKKILRLSAPNFIFLTDFKEDMPENPHGFAMLLRKHLTNARIRFIRQIDFERIVEIGISTKETQFLLILELFGRGNVVLCNDKWEILGALESQSYKDRQIKSHATYTYPKKKYNFLTLTESELKDVLENSKQDSVVKMLAVELGLGGVYSEELCLNSNIEKNKIRLSDMEISALYEQIKKLREKKCAPTIILKDNKPIDIVPFELNFYKGLNIEKKESFNKAIDNIISKWLEEREQEKKNSRLNREIERLNRVIAQQEQQIREFEKHAEEEKIKGEAIYKNYQLIDEIVSGLKNAREKYTWREIKAKLAGHKIIKEINEAKKEVTIEIEDSRD
ncbi:MAG: NFACT family protein [Candidatus Woesearchaeota archaeon]